MRRTIVLAVGLICAVSLAADDTSHRLTLEGVCSIDAPPGYSWQPLQPYDAHKGGQYMCQAPRKAGRIVLEIDPRHAGNQNARAAVLKIHFNTLVQTLKKNGFTNLKGEPPSFEPPIPDNVSYTVAGTTATGQARVFNGHSIFGNHTYFLQVVSTTLPDAEQLGNVAKTLKEPQEKPGE
ncbi:MAG TPA: hypothetical protein VK797_10880 [Tepidisphaeraceae bacterium]|nr:hypothetical protein [Tepidisphaeraceae bacterium]